MLEAREIAWQRNEIEAHLAECEGCRELHQSVAQFHKAVADELTAGDTLPALVSDRVPSVQQRNVRKRYDDYPAIPNRVDTALPVRMARWVAHHPYVAGGGTMLVIGLLGGLLLFNLRSAKEPLKDMNPVSMKSRGEVLLVQNKFGETIQALHVGVSTASQAQGAEHYGYEFGAFADIDGDGRNEIFWAQNPDPNIDTSATVFCQRVGDDHPLWQGRIHSELMFATKRGRLSEHFKVRSIAAGDYDGDGISEVYINAFHNFFPALVVKLDGRSGKELGKYVHAGHILSLLAYDFDGDGRKELLLAGANNGLHSAFLAVLDPRSISGHAPTSEAYTPKNIPPARELAYLLMPVTRLAKEAHREEFNMARIEHFSPADSTITVVVDDRIVDPIGNQIATIYLTFDRNLRCLSATPGNRYNLLYEQFIKEHRIPDQPLQDYLAGYISEFLYWDGTMWSKTPTWTRKYRETWGNMKPPA